MLEVEISLGSLHRVLCEGKLVNHSVLISPILDVTVFLLDLLYLMILRCKLGGEDSLIHSEV